jgi:hypothetical protein
MACYLHSDGLYGAIQLHHVSRDQSEGKVGKLNIEHGVLSLGSVEKDVLVFD